MATNDLGLVVGPAGPKGDTGPAGAAGKDAINPSFSIDAQGHLIADYGNNPVPTPPA